MITGSFLTEKFNETSDVDIIILSNIFRSVCIDWHMDCALIERK